MEDVEDHTRKMKQHGVRAKGLGRYAGWYSRVYVRVRLLRRESCTRGQVGWLSTGWLGEGARSKKERWREVEATRPTPIAGGELVFTRWEWHSCPSAHEGRFCPLASLPYPRQQRSAQSLCQGSGVWRVLTTTSDVETVTQGQGVPDHQMLPISGAQQNQAFLQHFCGGLSAGNQVSILTDLLSL